MPEPTTRRQFLKYGAAVTTAFAAACSPAAEPEAEDARPNIVLLMGDDHAWDEVAYNGHPHLVTPVLDEMAASGLRFDSFYSAHPSCSPTRASVMTGRHPNRCGTFSPNWSIRPEEMTIAQILGEAGYACGHFGKWHLGPVKADSPTSPGAMGFEEWVSHDNFFELDPTFSRNGGPPETIEGESSDIVIAEAEQFIERARQSGRPSFTVVWFGSPHEPYQGLEEDLTLYNEIPEQYNDRTVRLTDNETGGPTTRPLGDVLRERYAEITAMDRAIGRLRSFLSSKGLRENTIVWYCGDNGIPSSGRATTPFRGQKGDVYEGGVRVPGVLEWPARITAPRSTEVPAVTTDTLPTLCALVDAPLPDRPLDGVDLSPLIDGEMSQRPQPICFWSYPAHRVAGAEPYIDPALQQGTTPLVKLMDGKATRSFRNVRQPPIEEADYGGPRAILDNRYKLVVDADAGQELFDLQLDEAEVDNVAEQNPETAQDLARRLREWQESVLESLTGADYG